MRQIAELLFQQSLAKLGREGRSLPTCWEHHCLTAAIAAINAGDIGRAVGNLFDFERLPSDHEKNGLIPDQVCMSAQELKSVFEQLNWRT